MALNRVRFLSLLFVALALAPSLAHLLELPNKIRLSGNEYLTVQQIYRGWALLGIVVMGALLSTLMLTIMLRRQATCFLLALTAFSALSARRSYFGPGPIRPTGKPETGRACRTTGKRSVFNGSIPMRPAPC